MRWIVFFAALAVAGGCLSVLISGASRKRSAAVLAPLSVVVSAGLWALCLYLYARRQGGSLNRETLFPDWLSILAWAWAYMLISLLVGAALGCLRAGGLRAYFRGCFGSRWRRLALGGFLAGSLLLTLGCAVLAGTAPPSPLRFSEACCCNFSLLKDPNTDEYEDYLELENTGGEPLFLGGYFLSDKIKKRSLFRLPALTLEPGAQLLLWADGTGRSGEAGEDAQSLSFTLAPGETVYLSSPHGILLDQVTLGEKVKNVSETRREEEWIRAEGTPGESNAEAAEYVPPTLAAPVLSRPSGFYDGLLTLTVAAAEGCTVHYTTDGSVPDAEDPVFPDALTLTDRSAEPNLVLNHPTTTADRSGVVTEPVDKGTVLRLIALDGTGAFSEVVTATYFVGEQTFSKYEGRTVLNITADPLDLFGNYGICVTGLEYDLWLDGGMVGDAPYPFYYRRGRLLEKDAQIALWNTAHEPVLAEACGIRLQGDHTRAQPYKRFRLISRPIYSGSSTFSAPVVGGVLCHSFFTRQDTSDLIPQMLAEGLGLGGLDAEPAAVFINGEFYYDTYLRECYDKQYFLSHFNVKDSDLILISNSELDVGTKEDFAGFEALMDYIEQSDCADSEVYETICEQIDVENYAQYMALNIYLNNTDWSMYKNYKLWRTRKKKDDGVRDGRWRWLVYDMDGCTWSASKYGYHKAEFDAFRIAQPFTEVPFLEMPLFRDLLKNGDFRATFVRAWLDLMNGVLTSERLTPILERYGASDDTFWLSFLQKRPKYAVQILIDDLGLDAESCFLKISAEQPEGGTVKVNTVYPSFTDGVWTGRYITGFPVTLTAEPEPGWRFVGWRGVSDSENETVTLTLTGDTRLTAVFEKK